MAVTMSPSPGTSGHRDVSLLCQLQELPAVSPSQQATWRAQPGQLLPQGRRPHFWRMESQTPGTAAAQTLGHVSDRQFCSS